MLFCFGGRMTGKVRKCKRKEDMNKFLIKVVVIISVLTLFAGRALAAGEEEYANKLKLLGVFRGTEQGFELDRQPTRLEGLVIMLRLLGEEENALRFQPETEFFTDVPAWGKPYVYYAYERGITKGVSENTFAPEVSLQSYAFLTYMLRAMGYRDGTDDSADFIWNQPELFAMSKNLVNESQLAAWSVNPFYRKDAVRVAYTALNTKTAGGRALAEELIEKGVFSKAQAILAELTPPEAPAEPRPADVAVEKSVKQEDYSVLPLTKQKPSSPAESSEAVKPEFPDEKPYPLAGPATATRDQVYLWAQRKGMSEEGLGLIDIYFEICQKKGLNPVIQYAQMCHETGFLYKVSSMAGLDASFHNPCGLKVTEGGDGFVAGSHKRFADWREGIEAHTDHTALYAGLAGYPKADTPDPRHFPFLRGTAVMLSDLSGKWAPSWYYHRKIYQMLQEIEAVGTAGKEI